MPELELRKWKSETRNSKNEIGSQILETENQPGLLAANFGLQSPVL
jgi:hypothetical protein